MSHQHCWLLFEGSWGEQHLQLLAAKTTFHKNRTHDPRKASFLWQSSHSWSAVGFGCTVPTSTSHCRSRTNIADPALQAWFCCASLCNASSRHRLFAVGWPLLDVTLSSSSLLVRSTYELASKALDFRRGCCNPWQLLRESLLQLRSNEQVSPSFLSWYSLRLVFGLSHSRRLHSSPVVF